MPAKRRIRMKRLSLSFTETLYHIITNFHELRANPAARPQRYLAKKNKTTPVRAEMHGFLAKGKDTKLWEGFPVLLINAGKRWD
ncbi:MAG: hypothetical protein ABH872_04655 [Candidatus Omnitrophota bacterium]